MAKLAVHLVTLALFLFLANASIRTVTFDSEENPWGRQESSCGQQIKEQNYLEHCQKYMEEKCSSCKNHPSHLDSCCEQLEKLDRQCRCPGLKEAMQQQMQEGEMGRREMQEMSQMVDKIMSKCDMKPSSCDNSRGRQESSCRQQMKKQDNLNHCQKYMEEERSSSSDDLSGRKHLDSCCEQLEKLDRQCRCPGLKQAMQQQMQEGEMGREKMQDISQMVDKIMSKCDMKPGSCHTHSRSWI